MPIDASIPLRVERPKIVSPADLLSLKDLQTRSQLNQFNLQNAPEEYALKKRSAEADIDYKKSLSLSQIGKQKEDEQERHRKEAIRQATAIISAPPERRPAIYQGILQYVASIDPNKAAQMPQQYDDSLLSRFEGLAYGELSPEKAIEQAQFAQGPQAPQQAMPTAQPPAQMVDPESGAILRPMTGQPQGIPLSEVGEGLPPQLETTGQAAAPAVEAMPQKKVESIEDIYARANAWEAKGTPVGAQQAKALREYANKLEQREIEQEKLDFDRSKTSRENAKQLEDAKNKKFDNASTLRDDFEKMPDVKKYRVVQGIYSSMLKSAKTDTLAADMDLIYGIATILDPDSVVREADQIMVQKTASLPDWVIGAIQSVNGKARLQEGTRNAIMGVAKTRVAPLEKAYTSTVRAYKDIAKRNEIDDRDVIVDYRADKPDDGKGPRKEENNPPKKILKWDDIK